MLSRSIRFAFKGRGDSANAAALAAEVSNFGLANLGGSAVPTFAGIDGDGDGDLDAFVGTGDGVVRYFVNNSTFVLQPPTAVSITDTAFDDSFAAASRTLTTRGAESAALTYGISGGTDNGSTVSKTSTYGVLTVTEAGGASTLVPNDAASEALGATASTAFTVTVTNGTITQSKTLTASLAQSGTTETPGNDTLTGTADANRIDGLAANDTLSGGTGLDTFGFSSALNSGADVDTVTSFAAADDAMQLKNSVFLKLTTTGQLSSSFFRANLTGTAADSNDYIVYETDTGKLFYDADGNGAGASVLFATLTGAPVIGSVDFFVT